MNRRVIIAAVVGACAASMLGVQLASLSREAGPGPTFAPAGSCALRVTSVTNARAGTLLQPGDVLTLDRMTPAQRVLATHDSSAIGDSLSTVVIRAGRVSRVAETIAAREPASYWAPSVAIKVVMILVGVLLLLRGRDAASLHYGIASAFFAVAILPVSDSLLPAAGRNVYEALAQLCAGISAFALYSTFEDLAHGTIGAKVLSACRVLVGACALLFVANAIVFSGGRATTGCFYPLLYAVRFPALIVALAVMMGVLMTTFLRAAGVQRQRVRWVFWSTVVGFSGVVVWLIVPAYRAAVLTSVVITIGYAYAILRHRVIDVNFVINRAIVFTIVTSAVFAVFALLSTTVERLTPSESIGVQSIVAIALAFSFDFGYKRVETVIDRLFFREKHNAEVALRQFTVEARSVRSVSGLLEQALAVVCMCLRARSACVYRERAGVYSLAAADGAAVFPESIAASDPAFAALRANKNEIDLGDVGGTLTGDGYAFPLAARNGMIGALIVRARQDGEAYDPEERSLVRALTREVAAGLQAISEADRIEFIEQIAAGNLDPQATQARAQALIESDS